ncbi:TPA: S-layer homology domain-containing protein [Bacillus thuringiensis]|uniref:S-layer protein n=1 Tax=Bacillus wiedmannii TaxID=1890302 RepID=A0A2B5IAI9_9BACI|nr:MULTISPECIES: S-layer homology domain-containing protein [Bacillus]EOP08248.1 hypothetical protein ICS_04473 [Bacillus cereus BAG2O-3]EOQ13053.1 hypothetical protein KQ3_00418 [Bacillus cereus B5-2]EOQ33868.1 hypothetical protein KQ1_01042 [Bacillus cereus BAG3O-1]MBJ8117060.1 S-layer homology domain-containing protein [Bacillus cereus]PFW81217.1 S-layer protein [Bacillus sp. AFS075960]RFB11991.1 S-layer homology domain-containing protein [Bacillus sp. OE]RFB27754.1 S-layer homology domai
MRQHVLKGITAMTLLSGVFVSANSTSAEEWPVHEPEMIVFTDVAEDHWSKDAIYDLAYHKIMVGYGNGTFGAKDNVTREQAAAVIAHALKIPNNLELLDNPYTDINESTTNFAYEIKALTTRRIFAGYENNTFRPKDPVTRAQLAQIIVNAYEFKVKQKHTFTDVPDTHWATDAISALQSNDVVKGMGNGQYEPNTFVTREQFAVFLKNAMVMKALNN